MRVIVDRAKCIGSGNCLLAVPEVFDGGDDGLVILLADHPAPEHDDAVRDAVRLCPARAITVVP